MTAADDDAYEVALASAKRMWAGDIASRDLGMTLDEVRPGYARMTMRVDTRMIQGHGTGHGGYVFILADSTFAFACNSYGAPTVAAHCDISFLLPVGVGDVLVAEGTERTRYGRNGIYDVTVRRDLDVVAEFRGRSRTIGPA